MLQPTISSFKARRFNRRTAFLSISLFLLAIGAPGALHAQIYNCDGIWTNKPCGDSSKVFEEATARPEDQNSRAREAKRARLHKLSNAAFKAKHDYGVSFDLSAIEQLCLNSSTTLADCQAEIDKASDRLHARIVDERTLQQNETKTSKPAESGNQAIVIEQNIYPARTPGRFPAPTPIPTEIIFDLGPVIVTPDAPRPAQPIAPPVQARRKRFN